MILLFGIMLMILYWVYNLCIIFKNDNILFIICYVFLKFFIFFFKKRRKKNVIIN